MSTAIERYVVHLPSYFDDRVEAEMWPRGYLNDVEVELQDGTRHYLSFIDLVRLQQEASADFADGVACFTEPGLVVVPEVTLTGIRRAIERLYEEGYFRRATPRLPAPE